jgi:hypothetical protein
MSSQKLVPFNFQAQVQSNSHGVMVPMDEEDEFMDDLEPLF